MVTLTLLQLGSENDLFSMTEEEGIQKKKIAVRKIIRPVLRPQGGV